MFAQVKVTELVLEYPITLRFAGHLCDADTLMKILQRNSYQDSGLRSLYST